MAVAAQFPGLAVIQTGGLHVQRGAGPERAGLIIQRALDLHIQADITEHLPGSVIQTGRLQLRVACADDFALVVKQVLIDHQARIQSAADLAFTVVQARGTQLDTSG